MDLFNKQKIKNLTKEQNKLNSMNEKLRRQLDFAEHSNRSIEQRIGGLEQENEKLRNWILNFLEMNGKEMSFQVPYEHTVVPVEAREAGLFVPITEELVCERIYVPALDIRKYRAKERELNE